MFKDKRGGLVVDYKDLNQELKQALTVYSKSGGRGETALDQSKDVAGMLEKYDICCSLFHGFDRSQWTVGKTQERLESLPAA